MLTFVGLGLYDERSITVEGREALQTADRIFAEFYTSKLVGTDLQRLEYYHDASFEILDRAGVEQDPEPVLDAAESDDIAFVTAGDTMISTTHVDLRLRAHDRGIRTRIVHGTTAQSAASSLTGLQNYRFGKATTLPFPDAHGGGDVPGSVVDTIRDNRDRNLHTLVYLDIKIDDPHWDGEEEFMRADQAASLLLRRRVRLRTRCRRRPRRERQPRRRRRPHRPPRRDRLRPTAPPLDCSWNPPRYGTRRAP